jgi:capsular polysaccharide biosynthesis protein
MYQVVDAHSQSCEKTLLFRDVFLYGEEGIPLQGAQVVNRFVNFGNDQLLIWLMHHNNTPLSCLEGVTLPLYGDWSDNFWHWCYETLPVALRAHEAGFAGNYLTPCVPFAAQSLQLLGIAPERIHPFDGTDCHLECMCLPGKRPGCNPANLAATGNIRTRFRERFVQPGLDYRIYLSRNGSPATRRQVANEPALVDLLNSFGFLVLQMEKLTLAEQLHYSCNASVLVAPHGAALTHCTFQPEGSLVLELFAPGYINLCLVPTYRALRHRYFQVTSFCPHTGYPFGDAIEAPLDIIEMTLERELG